MSGQSISMPSGEGYFRLMPMLLASLLCGSQLSAQDAAPPAPAGAPAPVAAAPEPTPAPQPDPQQYRIKGDAALGSGLYEPAIKFYRQYWDAAPTVDILLDATDRLAQALLADDRQQATADLLTSVPERLARMTPDGSAKLTVDNRAVITFWSAQLQIQQNHIAEAIPLLLEVASTAPRLPRQLQVYSSLGDCYLALSQWAEAEAALRSAEALATTPDARQQVNLGMIRAQMQQGKLSEADARITEYWPDAKGRFRTKLGMHRISILQRLQKPREAYAFYREFFTNIMTYAVDMEDYPVLRGLGQALVTMKEYEAAISGVFDRMLPLFASDRCKAELMLDIAKAHDAAKQYPNAIRKYEDFLAFYGRNTALRIEGLSLPDIRLRIAELYRDFGDLPKSLDYFEQVLQDQAAAAAQRHRAATAMAWIHHGRQQFDQAIDYFLRSTEFEVSANDRASGEYEAAQIYFQLQNYKDAAQHFQHLADTYPETKLAEAARYRQGFAQFEAKRFRVAAEIFAQFLREHSDGEHAATALLQKGIAETTTADYGPAVETFRAFVARFPDHDQAPYALLEAAQAAVELDQPNDAIELLTEIIDNHRFSKYYPYALYHRTYLNLTISRYDEATRDGHIFILDFSDSRPDLAPDVYLWLGDHFANNGGSEHAERLFNELASKFPASREAPVALYEAAKNAYRQGAKRKALEYTERLFAQYADGPERIRAQAYFLQGDIYSLDNRFEAAAQDFENCRALVPRTELYYAATGRLGECHYAMASVQTDNEAEYRQALSFFQIIVDAQDVDRSLVEKARYRSAKVHELLGETDRAIDQYYEIFFNYHRALVRQKVFDWYYYSRAGFDLARLYIEQQRHQDAIRIYDKLCDSNTPTANDACNRAIELNKLFGRE